MRAVYYQQHGDADVLEVGDLPRPQAGAGQVLVQVGAAGVNPIDRRLRAGELTEYIQRTFPVIPGWDLAGRIVAVGPDVEGWQVGDEIVGLAFTWAIQYGTYAEFVPIAADAIARKPAEFSFDQAAALPLVSLTSWQSLAEFGELSAGQTALIQAGAGGIGSASIPIARHLGGRVYTTCREKNFDYVRERGADVAIDYTRDDYVAVIREREPEGLDLVLETQLNDTAISNAIKLVKDGGTVVYMNNEPPDTPEINERGIKTTFLHHRADGAMLEDLMTLYAQGALPVPEIEVLPLDAAADAHRRSESGTTRGKLVLHVQEL